MEVWNAKRLRVQILFQSFLSKTYAYFVAYLISCQKYGTANLYKLKYSLWIFFSNLFISESFWKDLWQYRKNTWRTGIILDNSAVVYSVRINWVCTWWFEWDKVSWHIETSTCGWNSVLKLANYLKSPNKITTLKIGSIFSQFIFGILKFLEVTSSNFIKALYFYNICIFCCIINKHKNFYLV